MELMEELWEKAYSSKVMGDRKTLTVETSTFHSEVYGSDYDHVLIDFAKPDSLICVLITTDCLSMGVHFPDVPIMSFIGAYMIVLFNIGSN